MQPDMSLLQLIANDRVTEGNVMIHKVMQHSWSYHADCLFTGRSGWDLPDLAILIAIIFFPSDLTLACYECLFVRARAHGFLSILSQHNPNITSADQQVSVTREI